MRAIEFISEVFNNSNQPIGRWHGYPRVGGGYEKEFNLSDGKTLSISIDNLDNNTALFNFSVDSHKDITGQGNAMQIFSIVGSAIQDFVGKRKPTIFVFTGSIDDPSRTKLYDRITQRLLSLPAFKGYVDISDMSSKWPEYLESDMDDIQNIEGQKIYVLAHSRYFRT